MGRCGEASSDRRDYASGSLKGREPVGERVFSLRKLTSEGRDERRSDVSTDSDIHPNVVAP